MAEMSGSKGEKVDKKRKSLIDGNDDQPKKKSKKDDSNANGAGTADVDEAEAKRLRKEARKAEKKAAKLAAKNASSEAVEEKSNGTTTAQAGAVNGDSEQRKEKKDKKSKPPPTENGDTSTVSGYVQDPSLSALPQSEIDSFLSSNFITIEDTKSSNLRPIISFEHLPSVTKAQSSHFKKFSKPTPIQSASWPFLLAGRDLVGVAETGSGKTLAFGVPCIAHISSSKPRSSKAPAQAVIVSPTRELAVQIFDQIELIAKPAGLSTVCVYGGVPKDTQRAALKTAHIVVATPGRLNDLIDEGSAVLSSVTYLVLDEADRMLDKGFEQEIRKIISACADSKLRQTLMFTATWPQSIRDLAGTFMRSPVKISIGDNPTGELRANIRITQTVEVMDPHGKEQRLLQLLKKHQSGKNKDDKILVFCLYKKEASRIENFLYRSGMRVAGIHGDLSQEKRTASLEGFKSGVTPLLVATDVAARGLDIPNVKMVINVTFPLTVEDYVHRIGRTGRAGASGQAITFFTEYDKALSGGLINVLKGAGQPVPEELLKFGTTVKKKGHEAYGAFYKDVDSSKTATKIKF